MGKYKVLSEEYCKTQTIWCWVSISVFFILSVVNILYYNPTHGLICLAIGVMNCLRLETLKENFAIYKKLSEIESRKQTKGE